MGNDTSTPATLTLSREKIMKTIMSGSYSKCRKLAKLVNPNVTMDDGNIGIKPIQFAISQCNYDAVKFLVANINTDVNCHYKGLDCLGLAVAVSNVSYLIVKELLKRRDLDVNAVGGTSNKTALMMAICTENQDTEKETIRVAIVDLIAGDPRCDLQKVDANGYTALTSAVRYTKVAMVNHLVRDRRAAKYDARELVRCVREALLKENQVIAQLIFENCTPQQKSHLLQHLALLRAAIEQRETEQSSLIAHRENQRSLALAVTSLPPNIHFGTQCDVCSVLHFTGPRYKCVVCVDYDLCGTCRSRNMTSHSHTNQHTMECLMPPVIKVGSVVMFISNLGQLEQLQRGYNGWSVAKMAQITDLPGIVRSFRQNGDLVVDFNLFPVPYRSTGPGLMICNPLAVRLFSKDGYEDMDSRGNLVRKDDTVKIMDQQTVMSVLASIGQMWHESLSDIVRISGRVLFFDRLCRAVIGISNGIDIRIAVLPAKAVLLVTGTNATATLLPGAIVPSTVYISIDDPPSYSALFG